MSLKKNQYEFTVSILSQSYDSISIVESSSGCTTYFSVVKYIIESDTR